MIKLPSVKVEIHFAKYFESQKFTDTIVVPGQGTEDSCYPYTKLEVTALLEYFE